MGSILGGTSIALANFYRCALRYNAWVSFKFRQRTPRKVVGAVEVGHESDLVLLESGPCGRPGL
jgi:hypothetical protein